QPADDLPGTPGVRFYLEDDTRIIVRPSGTEPKIKVYLEAIVPVEGRGQLKSSRAEASQRLAAAVKTMTDLTSAD
ncbi:MAG: phospho-sugar mutase, partial [Ornithinimicrobium sp.]